MSDSVLSRNGWLIDLLGAIALAVMTAGLLVGPGVDGAALWLIGVPFLIFLPGYAVVSAMFPEEPPGAVEGPSDSPWSSPEWTTRLAVSFVLSGIVVAVVGVALGLVGELRLGPAVGGITAITLLGAEIGIIRRLLRPHDRRANPFGGRSLGALSAGTTAQNVTLVVAVLALVGAVAFVGATPTDGEAYTESYLLSEDEAGDLVADDYPTTFVAGEGHPLHLGIENNEHRDVTYEVDVVIQETDANGSVTAQQQVDEFVVDLQHGESLVVERTIAPTMTGDGLRLQFHIYKDGAADTPDHTLQLWVEVVDESDA